jgi:hypothetical protein
MPKAWLRLRSGARRYSPEPWNDAAARHGGKRPGRVDDAVPQGFRIHNDEMMGNKA